MEKLGERLRELRKEKDLTQEELASKLKISKSALGMYETGKRIPTWETMEAIADFFNVDMDFLYGKTKVKNKLKHFNNSTHLSIYEREEQNINFCEKPKNKVAVLGTVQAGIPIEAIEDILGYEELSPNMVESGAEYFALRVKGDSMLPRFQEGDVVIVRKQSDVNHDDIAIVLVGNEEATIKRIVKSEVGIMLVANNPSYEPKFYSNKDIAEKPVTILGKVVELRAKF